MVQSTVLQSSRAGAYQIALIQSTGLGVQMLDELHSMQSGLVKMKTLRHIEPLQIGLDTSHLPYRKLPLLREHLTHLG